MQTQAARSPVSTEAISTTANQRIGWFLAITTTFIYSFQPVILKSTLNEGVNASDLLVVRFVIASIIFIIMLQLRNNTIEVLPKRAIFWCAMCGFFFVGGIFSYTTALNYTSASVTSMIFSAFPIITLFLLTLFGERFNLRKGIRVVLGLLGVYLIIGPGGNVNFTGVALALLGCTTYACYLVVMQRSLSNYQGKTIMLYITGFTAFFFILLNISNGINFASFTPVAWLLILYQATIGTYIVQLLLFSAVKAIGSGQFALLFPLELLLTIFWSILLLSESLSLNQTLGGMLIIVSLLLAINNPKFIRRRIFRPRI